MGTGRRLSGMEAATRRALDAISLPFEVMVLKPQRERMRGTAAWKVAVIREHAYEPLHILDDDAEIQAALGLSFPPRSSTTQRRQNNSRRRLALVQTQTFHQLRSSVRPSTSSG